MTMKYGDNYDVNKSGSDDIVTILTKMMIWLRCWICQSNNNEILPYFTHQVIIYVKYNIFGYSLIWFCNLGMMIMTTMKIMIMEKIVRMMIMWLYDNDDENDDDDENDNYNYDNRHENEDDDDDDEDYDDNKNYDDDIYDDDDDDYEEEEEEDNDYKIL